MFILLLLTMINVVGFGMMVPLIPGLKVYFGLEASQVGHVISVFAMSAVFGSVIFGYLSDKFGRKKLLLYPLLFLSISYFLTPHVHTFSNFLLLRAISGFMVGHFCVAFASVADLSSKEDRLKKMGFLAAAFNLGFVIGPAVSGLTVDANFGENHSNFSLPFYLLGFLTFISFILVLFFFKETLKIKKAEIDLTKDEKLLKKIINAYSNKSVIYSTFLMVVFTSVLMGMQIYMGVWLTADFNFNVKTLSIYWSSMAIFSVFIQVILIRYLNINTALTYGFLFLALGYLSFYFTSTNAMLYFSTLLVALGLALIMPGINARVSVGAAPNQQGFIIGVTQAVGGIGRAIGPVIFGLFYAYYGVNGMWLICFAIRMIVFLSLIAVNSNNKKKVGNA